jgi:hypothetical protein
MSNPLLAEKASASTPPKTNPIAFAVIDAALSPGSYRSSSNPAPYISLADPSRDLQHCLDADEDVIPFKAIRVLYNYPLGNSGPSYVERVYHGFVFTETSPTATWSRAQLAKAISSRYHAIYQEEDETSLFERLVYPCVNPHAKKLAEGELPEITRNTSAGKYAIYGHLLTCLKLHTVRYIADLECFILSVDA